MILAAAGSSRRRPLPRPADQGAGLGGDVDQHRCVHFDFDEVFGDDYLHFYASQLTDERNDRETSEIVSLLGLQDGDTILDAPCGHGRISNRLAERGLHLVGVDASAQFLELARQAGPGVDYRLGDLRELPVDGPFDAVISWFTSFGYFDDDGNRQVLAEYRRVLRPGGRLLLETQNHDEFVRRFTPAPFSHGIQVNDDLMSTRASSIASRAASRPTESWCEMGMSAAATSPSGSRQSRSWAPGWPTPASLPQSSTPATADHRQSTGLAWSCSPPRSTLREPRSFVPDGTERAAGGWRAHAEPAICVDGPRAHIATESAICSSRGQLAGAPELAAEAAPSHPRPPVIRVIHLLGALRLRTGGSSGPRCGRFECCSGRVSRSWGGQWFSLAGDREPGDY